MKDVSKSPKDEDNDNNDIDRYFADYSDNSFSSYENNDNDSNNNFYNFDSNSDEKKGGNQNNHIVSNKISDYLNNNPNIISNSVLNNNSNINNNFRNKDKNININNNININKESNVNNNFNFNNSKITNSIYNNNNHSKSINNINNISINNFSKSNSINMSTINNNIGNNKIKKCDIDEDLEELFFPNLNKNNNDMKNNTNSSFSTLNNNINNKDLREKLTETKIIDNLSLSSSSNDIQIVSSEEFRKHFQEERFGPQRRIEILDTQKQLNMPFSRRHDQIKRKINNNQDFNKCFDAFFLDEKNENQKNKNLNLFPKAKLFQDSKANNKIINRKKKFSPLPKDKYRNNNTFHKLLINRLEKQILTGIYDDYQNKEEFDETYYHIERIKHIINNKGVEDAMNYLIKIEPISLKNRVILESTFFFKEIIREEVEFAENNDGKLILFKQSDYIYNQNNRYNAPLIGKINGVKRGRTRFEQNYMYNNRFNTINVNDNRNEDMNFSFYSSNFNKNPYMYKSPKPLTKHRKI